MKNENKLPMKKTAIILIALALIAGSCGQTMKKQDKMEKHRDKYEQIQFVIEKSGFVRLPLSFDPNLEYALPSKYYVNLASNDTLLFDRVYDIVGFLPDTTNYYAFLYLSVGDILYPTIKTMDKNWQEIDEKIICVGGCAGHAQLDITSCSETVCISEDLKIKSVSKVIGEVEIEDTIPQVLNICNMKILEGLIDKYGKINLKESGLIDCNE